MFIFPTYNQCLNEELAGNVYKNVSPCGHFVLFNYNPKVEYENLWNETNMWCRGIIFDIHTEQVVAVPFRKFWNVGQKPEVSEENLSKLGTPVVMSKEDGSLGILFWNLYEKKWQVATRGSFESDQAAWASNWIRNQTCLTEQFLTNGETHLFEIVYRENKIVADYGGFEGLIYLNTVVWESADNSCYYSFGGARNEIVEHIQNNCQTIKLYSFSSFAKMHSLLESFTKDQEGFVLLFPDGTMAKMKGAEYLRVHKLRSTLSIGNVADMVIATGDFESVLADLPDEFWGDYVPALQTFREAVEESMEKAKCVAKWATVKYDTRKEQAFFIKVEPSLKPFEVSMAFNFLDNKEEVAFKNAIKAHAKSKKFEFKSFLGNN